MLPGAKRRGKRGTQFSHGPMVQLASVMRDAGKEYEQLSLL